MAIVNKPGLLAFLVDCGVGQDPSKIAQNRLNAGTVQVLGAVSSQAQKTLEANATQIGEMIGLFVSPEFGAEGAGPESVMRVSLSEFLRVIGGRPKAFVQFLLPAARYVEKQRRFPAILAIAQAAHETAWGSPSAVATYNLWNLRAYPDWIKSGHKFYDTKVNGTFKDYNNFMEAIEDYVSNYFENTRYRTALVRLLQGGTPEQFVQDIAPIYAPSSDGNSGYAAGVIRAMNEIRQMGLGL